MLLAALAAAAWAMPAAASEGYVVAPEPGSPAARVPGVGPSTAPARAARAFLERNAARSGLTRRDARLRATGATALRGGARAVRFRQEVGGVPVLGAEHVVTVRPDGQVSSAAGARLQGPAPDLRPEVPAASAARTALAVVARRDGVGVVRLSADAPELVIFDPALAGAPGGREPRLAWQVIVRGRDGDLRVRVLVDAGSGALAGVIDMNSAALHREVCDAALQPSQVPCAAPVLVEGQEAGTGLDPQVADAFAHAGAFHGFLDQVLGWDSLDGAGAPLRQTVRYCDTTRPSCDPALADDPATPDVVEHVKYYDNAFWNGREAVFGSGWATADIVGHEFAHGLVEHTAGLFYWYQSGAINESMADIFGELAQQHAGAVPDSERWLIGEHSRVGAIRSMEDPTAFGDPDRMTSPLYHDDRSDHGGVHHNAGVGNRAAALMADGGDVNGEVVQPIGIEATARIHHRALTTLLRSGSGYADLAAALPAACAALAAEGGHDIREGDCDQVAAAVRATEMHLPPAGGPVPAAACAPGEEVGTVLLAEGFEEPLAGRWTAEPSGGSQVWWRGSEYPPGWNAVYATEGGDNLFGDDYVASSDAALRLSAPVTVPAGAVLHFRHAHGFDRDDVNTYDGGVVEYSTDAGTTWIDAGDLVEENGYTGTISTAHGNALAGRAAFTAESAGYTATRVDLSSLEGEEVLVRFRLATDDIGYSYGWYIDEVSIHTCEPDGVPQTTITAAPRAHTASTTATVAFTSSLDGGTFTCRLDDGPAAPCTSPAVFPGLAEGPHAVEVTAVSELGVEDPSPARAQFTVDTTAPVATITSVPQQAYAPARLEYAFQANEEATFSCALDDGPFTDCASPHAYPDVPAGTHHLRVTAVDRAGNAGPVAATVLVVTPPPPTVAPEEPQPQPEPQPSEPAPAPAPSAPAPSAPPAPAPQPAPPRESGPAPVDAPGPLPRRAPGLRLPATLAQIVVNQRIAVAAIRRLNAINARLEGRPAPPASRRPGKALVAGTTQLRINQRISEAAYLRAARLYARLGGTGAAPLTSIASRVVFNRAGVGANQLTNIRTLDMLNAVSAHLSRR